MPMTVLLRWVKCFDQWNNKFCSCNFCLMHSCSNNEWFVVLRLARVKKLKIIVRVYCLLLYDAILISFWKQTMKLTVFLMLHGVFLRIIHRNNCMFNVQQTITGNNFNQCANYSWECENDLLTRLLALSSSLGVLVSLVCLLNSTYPAVDCRMSEMVDTSSLNWGRSSGSLFQQLCMTE